MKKSLYGLFSNSGCLKLEAFTDVDCNSSIDDKISTSSYYTLIGGNIVTWRSKKQVVVTKSSVEAEYKAITHGVYELMWLQILLSELGFRGDGPIRLYYDNKVTINIAYNPIQHDKTKHVEIDRHFIKELNNGLICMPFLKSENELVMFSPRDLVARFFICINLRESVSYC